MGEGLWGQLSAALGGACGPIVNIHRQGALCALWVGFLMESTGQLVENHPFDVL